MYTCFMNAYVHNSIQECLIFVSNLCPWAMIVLTKGVNTVLEVILIWLREWNISIPINTDVPFWDYHYIYIYIYVCMCVCIYMYVCN